MHLLNWSLTLVWVTLPTTLFLLATRWDLINEKIMSLLPRNKCIMKISPLLQEYFQPPVSCNFCRDVKEIRRESKLSPEEFEEWYAYNSQPVIVTDAQTNWTAGRVFSVEYFIKLYADHSHNVEHRSHCQFFSYLSGFYNLEEALRQISPKNSGGLADNKPWYFGWSNCDPMVSNELRSHYSKPYFLPKNSYLSLIDWIFMGQPGYGANMHVDRVKNPSWQAQIRGRKRWILLPPMECYKACHKLDFVVEPGEIIILDTNVWFHQTRIIGDEVSIVIGSEYD